MISFMLTTGSLNTQDMIRILKQWRDDFSGKHLCDGYCMDIMWCFNQSIKTYISREAKMKATVFQSEITSYDIISYI